MSVSALFGLACLAMRCSRSCLAPASRSARCQLHTIRTLSTTTQDSRSSTPATRRIVDLRRPARPRHLPTHRRAPWPARTHPPPPPVHCERPAPVAAARAVRDFGGAALALAAPWMVAHQVDEPNSAWSRTASPGQGPRAEGLRRHQAVVVDSARAVAIMAMGLLSDGGGK